MRSRALPALDTRGRLAERKLPSFLLRSMPCPWDASRGRGVRSRTSFCTVKVIREHAPPSPCSRVGTANGYSMPSTLRVRLIRPPSSMISRMNGGNGWALNVSPVVVLVNYKR